MSEPMIPQSMHVSAVEAARTFARQEAEHKALVLIARIVEAAGGEVRLSCHAVTQDEPDLFMSEEWATNEYLYRTKRKTPTAMRGAAETKWEEFVRREPSALDVELLARAMEDVFPGWMDEAPGTAEAQAEMRDYARRLGEAYDFLRDSASPGSEAASSPPDRLGEAMG